MLVEKGLQDQVELEHSPPAAPAQTAEFRAFCHRLQATPHQHLFDLADGACGIKFFGTDLGAIHDGVTPDTVCRIGLDRLPSHESPASPAMAVLQSAASDL